MLKLSELFKNDFWGAYLIGTIYAFQYKSGNNFISLFVGRNQKSTNHKLSMSLFYKQLDRIERFYNVKLAKYYSPISNYNNLDHRIKKWAIGLCSIVENDLKGDIWYEIIEKLDANPNFAINFVRGIIDSRSSGDKTFNYIAMDIKKIHSVSFSIAIVKAFDTIFGRENIKYNINPRFKQPSKKSRMKNPQFRVPYHIVFGDIGTFRMQFLIKAKENQKVWLKLKTNTNIPNDFEDIIKWDTSNISYTSRSKDNIRILQGDVDYLKNYHLDKEGSLYLKLKEEYSKNYDLEIKKRVNLDSESIKLVLAKTNKKDFLEPSKYIEKNKNDEPLMDIHHIIPHRYGHLFNDKSAVNSIENLVPLRPDTHYFLHRGAFNEKKEKYLKTLFDEIKFFLIKQELHEKINFTKFKNMY